MFKMCLNVCAALGFCVGVVSCGSARSEVGSAGIDGSKGQGLKQASETYVLVHGAWAGGWEWKGVGQLLQKHGHTVYRATLTGQGERVHLARPETDLNTHITDVVNLILFEDLHDVVLTGHSYGGMVITGVVDRIPERIKRVVYIDAAVPENGETANVAVGRPNVSQDSPGAQAALTPAGWPYPPDRKPPYIVPQPWGAFNTPLELRQSDVAFRIPTMYILTVDKGGRAEEDMFYRAYQRAKGRGWSTRVMEGDHVVNVTRPAALVDLLERGATSPGVGGT